MNKSYREIVMGFSICQGRDSQSNKRVNSSAGPEIRRKEPDQLTRQSDQADLQSGWNMETERETKIRTIHSKKPQQIGLKLEILQGGEQPTIQK